jgi:hypothetical protein
VGAADWAKGAGHWAIGSSDPCQGSRDWARNRGNWPVASGLVQGREVRPGARDWARETEPRRLDRFTQGEDGGWDRGSSWTGPGRMERQGQGEQDDWRMGRWRNGKQSDWVMWEQGTGSWGAVGLGQEEQKTGLDQGEQVDWNR